MMMQILGVTADFDDNTVIVKNDSGDILHVYEYTCTEDVDQVLSKLQEIIYLNNVLRERWNSIVEEPYRDEKEASYAY